MLTVYIKLLNEGTLVFRPAYAERVDKNTVKLLPVADYNQRDEEWEFPPGSIVRCESRVMDDENILVPVELCNQRCES
jgi:hypothetical protein